MELTSIHHAYEGRRDNFFSMLLLMNFHGEVDQREYLHYKYHSSALRNIHKGWIGQPYLSFAFFAALLLRSISNLLSLSSGLRKQTHVSSSHQSGP